MMLTPSAPGKGDDGGTQAIALTSFHQLSAKASILVIPIYADGHWTLLTVWRSGVKRAEEEGCAPLSAVSTGCSKCSVSACAQCSPVEAWQLAQRKATETAVLNPWGIPDLPDACTDWQIDYFDIPVGA